jgi:hypothetical protein
MYFKITGTLNEGFNIFKIIPSFKVPVILNGAQHCIPKSSIKYPCIKKRQRQRQGKRDSKPDMTRQGRAKDKAG